MDVSGRGGRGLVVTGEAIDGDIVANNILGGVDAEVEHASAALKTTSGLVLGVDYLVGASDDVVGRGELERTVHVHHVVGAGDLVGAGHRRGLGEGSEGEGSDGLHFVRVEDEIGKRLG